MDDAGDDTPDLQLLSVLQFNGGVIGVLGQQTDLAAPLGQALDGEFAIDHSDHDGPVVGMQRAISDQQVAILDAGTGHRFAPRAQKEGRFLVGNQVFVEIERFADVVVRRAGKAGMHRVSEERQWQAHWRWRRIGFNAIQDMVRVGFGDRFGGGHRCRHRFKQRFGCRGGATRGTGRLAGNWIRPSHSGQIRQRTPAPSVASSRCGSIGEWQWEQINRGVWQYSQNTVVIYRKHDVSANCSWLPFSMKGLVEELEFLANHADTTDSPIRVIIRAIAQVLRRPLFVLKEDWCGGTGLNQGSSWRCQHDATPAHTECHQSSATMEAAMLAKTRKRLTARITDHVQEKLQAAADLVGVTLNQFVVQAALEKAEEVIVSESTLILTRRESLRLLEMSENPPPRNEKFLQAQTRYQMLKNHDGSNA